MDTNYLENNYLTLVGKVTGEKKFSHEIYGESFYIFNLMIPRLSGNSDIIPITVSERLIKEDTLQEGNKLLVKGQFRSYNSYENERNRLILTVFAKDITELEDDNEEEIEENEKDFEEEVTNIKINMGTVINSNYWRIEGIKNIYKVFQEEVSEKFNKDLSEYRIEEIEDMILPGNEEEIEQEDEIINETENEYIDEEYDEEEYDDEFEEDEYYEEEYQDDEDVDYYEDEENDNDYEETEEDEGEEEQNEVIEDDIDAIIEKSRKKASSKNDEKMSKGFFGKFFKK